MLKIKIKAINIENIYCAYRYIAEHRILRYECHIFSLTMKYMNRVCCYMCAYAYEHIYVFYIFKAYLPRKYDIINTVYELRNAY